MIEYDILARNFPQMYLPHTQFVRSLHDALRDTNFEVIYGAEARSIVDTADDRKLVRYNKGSSEYELTGDLIVVADGGSSSLRSQLGIAVDMVDYNVGYQMVILDKSSGFKGGQHCLSPEGFVGLFSMPNNRMRAAVELSTEQLKEWIPMDKDQINDKLRMRVPYVNDLRVRDVGIFYRVIRRQANEFWRRGVILIGDAAHTTHPMLGQGMSMVFNDISVFGKVISRGSSDPFSEQVLGQYEKEARRFSSMVIENSELLFRAFQAIGKDADSLKNYLPMLHGIGFMEAG